MKTGEKPIIGVKAMCELFIGWKIPDPKNPPCTDGYNVENYFDRHGCYRGPDYLGVEPVFRDLTKEEIKEYLDLDAHAQ